MGDFEEVDNFPEPQTREVWKFMDPDEDLFGEEDAIDISADLLLDGEGVYLGDFLIAIGNDLKVIDNDHGSAKTIRPKIIRAARAWSSKVGQELFSDRVNSEYPNIADHMKPASDESITQSVVYALNTVLKILSKKR